jgi:hypothetical protein
MAKAEKSRRSSSLRTDLYEETTSAHAMPWLDADTQPFQMLQRTLYLEASRFEELPYQSTFSLLSALCDPRPAHLNELLTAAQRS